MPRALEDIRDEALRLDPHERLVLVQELHDSLMTAEEREIEEAWFDEAERRYDDWKAGRAQTVPGDEMFARLREKYGSDDVRVSRRR